MIPQWASRSNVPDFTTVNGHTNQDTLRLTEVFVFSSIAPALYSMDLKVLTLIGCLFRRHNLTLIHCNTTELWLPILNTLDQLRARQ